VEESIFVPLQEIIIHTLQDAPGRMAEAAFVAKLGTLRKKDVAFFGGETWSMHIPVERWDPAIFEIELMGTHVLPSRKLEAVLGAAQNICDAYKVGVDSLKEAGKPVKDEDYVLGADDFFPIFLFVVVQSGLEQPFLAKELMWGLCEPGKLKSEGGYYLTVFEAAIVYLSELLLKIEP
jgi:hypothetical protein